MNAGAVRVPLSGGSWIDGISVREATVRPITGADQVILAERAKSLPAVERASTILGLCVAIDAVAGDSTETARRLSIGDREALLLHLHRLTFGSTLHCVLTCPHEECAERMDLDVDSSDLLVGPYERADQWYELSSTPDHDEPPVRFRLATGLDQETAVATAPADPAAAAEALALRCVASADGAWKGLPPLTDETIGRLAAAMLDRDPQAEIVLDMTCPHCGREVTTLLDAGAFLYEELVAALPRLYREVHTLALRYHWSESDILGLTQPQRQRYLGLLAETVGDDAS